MRLIISAIACASLIAAPVAAQTATIKNSAPVLSQKSGKPAAKTWAEWWSQLRGLPDAKPPLGDIVEPELGVNLDKIPAMVAPNYNRASLIDKADMPGTAAPDVVGAFRFDCEPGQISYDDPVVFPGQPGKSHLHQWFGNTAANAKSTYQSLRTTGDSTCVNILNRSAYWMPAMLDGRGNVVRPDYVAIYYKRLPETSPQCQTLGKACVALPRGLRYIFGYNMLGSGGDNVRRSYFNCQGPTAKSGSYALLTDAAPNCGPGNQLGAIIASPECWDGAHLDSPDHRSHMGYPAWNDRGELKCPVTHPYVVPTFTMGAWYSTDTPQIGQPGSVSTWYLSSDEMPGMDRMPAGSTFHADWFGAWDDATMDAWVKGCINALKSCNSGLLGDGTGMRQRNNGMFQWKANPRLVPIPARPTL